MRRHERKRYLHDARLRADPKICAATTSKRFAASRKRFASIRQQLSRIIVGQEEVIEELLIALFSRGHCILEGVPGLAKTLMISTLSKCAVAGLQPHPVHARLDAVRHHRHRGHRGEPHAPAAASSSSSPGPLFANVILADEINRTPPKTQAALLEAMQERQVTVGRVRHRLDDSVLRAGHAEPDRAGRHLSAARSAARPLHVQGLRAAIPSSTRSSRSPAGPRRWPPRRSRRS